MADVRLAIGLILLLGICLGTLTLVGVTSRRAALTAVVRGGVQLAFVGVALRGVLAAPVSLIAVFAVMLGTASYTASGRLKGLPSRRPLWQVALFATVVGAGVVLAVVFAIPVLTRSVRYAIAFGGITIGGTMTGTGLTGRLLLRGMQSRRAEIEGMLALGATNRQSVLTVARDALSEALLPALDQTRTVGLVTLPGAFIGALLGGASPALAARFQIVVLVGLLAAQTVAGAVVIRLLGAPAVIPEAA